MAAKERDGLDAFLFSESAELVDIKCFRGHRDDISEQDVRDQIHEAFMQQRLKRAVVSSQPPSMEVPQVNVRDFVADLAKSC